jgi:hypothetical protein
MSIRSGLAAQLGFAAESTVGTYATPDHFTEMLQESLKLQIERIESKAIRASNRVLRSDRWVANKKGVSGDVQFEVANKGFGLLFKHMLGAATVTTPTGATDTRLQTFTLDDMDGLSLTVQVGRPDTSGTVQPFSYLGCKVTSWELSNAVDGLLALTLSFDGMDEDTSQDLESVSYPTSQELLSFVGGSIKIADSAYDVTSFSVKGDNGLKTDRYFIRDSTLKREQLPAQMVELSGQIASEFGGTTAYERFTEGTMASIEALWQGSTIEGSFKYQVKVTLPKCRFDGETPNVGGPDILEQPLPFKALYDGTNEPITIEVQTTDTAV